MTRQYPQPHEGMTGIDRSDSYLLSLDPEAVAHRDVIINLVGHLRDGELICERQHEEGWGVSSVDDLIVWLRAVLDDEERGHVDHVARVMYAAWHDVDRRPWEDQATDVREEYRVAARRLVEADAVQVLRDVEAKRRIMRRYENAVAAPASLVSYIRGQDRGYAEACLDALRDFASAYTDRPGYRPEWAPDASGQRDD